MGNKIVDNFQKEILVALGKTNLAKKIYWSGGTALAYQYLKHRRSFDLDFFSDDLYADDWILSELNKIKKEARIDNSSYQKKLNRWIYFFKKDKELVKFEIVYYPFQAIDKRLFNKDFNIKVDSLLDIAANKVQTIFERQEPKDVFDLYWLLKTKQVSLEKLFQLVEKKFGSAIDPVTWSLRAIETSRKISKLEPLYFKKFEISSQQLVEFYKDYSFKILKKKIG